MAKEFDLEEALVALRREFAGTLPGRLAAMRDALDRLTRAPSVEALQAFYLPTHALQGTAGSYDAHELVPHTSRLATLGRSWRDGGAAPAAEVDEATHELAALEAAMERYRVRVGG